ncbi:hypothetical protein QEH56_24130 [Pelagicoccus enzymogenes]|uniref:hypothetical protein n=1 Tax=Pelagicoccus enzymogenes TaxID=2773457 RepID=UPI00280EAB34|nr:hypothetical protein [Pelagicoccus enzymogenes]MDQ8201270.1 hypothetical protein [Pelagicoccus enzymogenes]
MELVAYYVVFWKDFGEPCGVGEVGAGAELEAFAGEGFAGRATHASYLDFEERF